MTRLLTGPPAGPSPPVTWRHVDTNDMAMLASRFPQQNRYGHAQWVFAGGVASHLFHQHLTVSSFSNARPRERSPFTRDFSSNRLCKDADLYIFGKRDPFTHPTWRIAPFFRRYVTDDGLSIETTRSWYFYTPPPSELDIVQVGFLRTIPLLTVSPEYLCASHLKAIVEGREQSMEDAYHAFRTFQDFDTSVFLQRARQLPVFQALGSEEVVSRLLLSLLPSHRSEIREVAIESLRRYYSETFGAAAAVEAMNEHTLRLLANGVGFLRPPTPEEQASVPPITSREESFWAAVFHRFGISDSLPKILDKAVEISQHRRRDPSEERRVNYLLALAVSLEEWHLLRELAVAKIESPGIFISIPNWKHRVAQTLDQLSHLILQEFAENAECIHPLKNTFRGVFRFARQMLLEDPERGLAFLLGKLFRQTKKLVEDTKEIHDLTIE